MGMKIYLASSWRNKQQPAVVKLLRDIGHEVYDFRHPRADDDGFHWSSLDPDWQHWTIEEYRHCLQHPIAKKGFGLDFAAMQWADGGVLLLPCGRSAHLEAGWFIGAGKPLHILLSEDKFEPELMYLAATSVSCSLEELAWCLAMDRLTTDSAEPARVVP